MRLPVMVMEPRTALVEKVILYMCLEHDIVRGAIVAVKPDKWPVVLHHEQSREWSRDCWWYFRLEEQKFRRRLE